MLTCAALVSCLLFEYCKQQETRGRETAKTVIVSCIKQTTEGGSIERQIDLAGLTP